MTEVAPAPFSPSRALRFAAYAEGTTLLALVFIGMPLKHAFGIGLPNLILGPLHGFVLFGYAGVLLAEWYRARPALDWVVLAAIASLLPGGTFWFFAAPRSTEA